MCACRACHGQLALLSSVPLRVEGLYHRPSDLRNGNPFASAFRTHKANRFPPAGRAEIGSAGPFIDHAQLSLQGDRVLRLCDVRAYQPTPSRLAHVSIMDGERPRRYTQRRSAA
jgi:hypothetical protein